METIELRVNVVETVVEPCKWRVCVQPIVVGGPILTTSNVTISQTCVLRSVAVPDRARGRWKSDAMPGIGVVNRFCIGKHWKGAWLSVQIGNASLQCTPNANEGIGMSNPIALTKGY